jgi:hypothetical protein
VIPCPKFCENLPPKKQGKSYSNPPKPKSACNVLDLNDEEKVEIC